MDRAAINRRISECRRGRVTLRVTGPDGRPWSDREVHVSQVRHRFRFGCNAYGLLAQPDATLEAAYQQCFVELFNYATLPFYWNGYEKVEGQLDAERLRRMAAWCRAHGILPKGHPLCYHMNVPAWLYDRPFAEIKALQLARVAREVRSFAGLIDTWDVINEAVFAPGHEGGRHPLARVARRMGRAGLVKAACEAARVAGPQAELIINDCDPTPAYDRLVRDSLQAGAAMDVVGIQSHMHKGYWGPDKAWRVCERFARHGKPLHFSELTILSGLVQPDHSWSRKREDWLTTPEGEQAQAAQVEELYRLLFSHPAVEAITWWDFSDRGAWLGAPAGLVRKDMSPKPAYEALVRLIRNEWWTGEYRVPTDGQGRAEIEGFLGDYTVVGGRYTGVASIEHSGPAAAAVTLHVPA